MTSYEPPVKKAFDDAELALAIEAAPDALAAMATLEQQARLRAEDAEAYVAWVRAMEAEGSAESKLALTKARRAQAGLPAENDDTPTDIRDDAAWKKHIPDWDARQEAQVRATEIAIEEAKQRAIEKAEQDREAAVAAALAETEAEAERLRDEAVSRIREEAAQRLQAEIAEAEEQARIEAEQIAQEQRRLAEEAAEVRRIEAARIAEEQRLVEERQAEELRVQQEQLEAERLAELELLDQERIENERRESERLENERRAAEALKAAQEVIEPEPQKAAEYATGSFDIIQSAEQSVDEEEDQFDYLLSDGELPFAREPKSGAIDKPLSTISRRSKAISQLFVWGGLTVGVAPLVLAAAVSHLQNVGDGVIAMALGFLFSSTIISVAAIAGKRSGLSTLVLARAAFGVNGNMVSAIPLVLIKLAFGAGLIYSATSFFDGAVIGAPALSLAVGTSAISWQFVVLAGILLVAGTLAFFGGKVLYWAQLVTGAVGALAVIAFVAATAGSLKGELFAFSATPDFVGLVAISSLIGIFFGAFWITAVAEFTRKIPMRESGKKMSLFVALATGILPLLISSYALLAFKSTFTDAKISKFTSPLIQTLMSVPAWAATILLYSGILTLVIWAASWMYATSVSFAAIRAKLHPGISQPIIFVLTLLIAAFASSYINYSLLAVIVLAWAGIFVGDVALRRIAYHEVSLAREYGFYRSWNWVNISGFVVAVAIGLGLVGNVEGIYSWMGYISDDYLTAGIYIAPLVAFLFPILFGRKRVKSQEQEVLKIEARKTDLIDVIAE